MATTKRTTVCVATFETRHFQFTAVATDRTHAKHLLQLAWHKHCEHYPDADPGHFKRYHEDTRYESFTVGQVRRDGDDRPIVDERADDDDRATLQYYADDPVRQGAGRGTRQPRKRASNAQ